MSCKPNEEHLTLVRSGNASVNEWRKENPNEQLKLCGLKFQGLAVGSLDLSDADLEGATFTDCKLPNVVFENANLKSASFTNCELQNSIYIDAILSNSTFSNVNLNAAEFGDNSTISRIKHISLSSDTKDCPKYGASEIPVWDRVMSWEKLRFLRSINIFVPSYAALIISVLYLNGFSAINYVIRKINDVVVKSPELLGVEAIEFLEPGVRHIWVILAFFCLAVAATLFLACPSRIADYSREQWESDVKKSSLLYDHASWGKRWARIPCSALLMVGGLIAVVLFLVFVCSQVAFVVNYSAPTGAI